MLEFWKSIGVVREFSVYFLSEWCGERWNTRKIFDTPMGFSSTNNPVKSQKKQFKQFFTCWVIMTTHRAILMICEKYLVTTSKCAKMFSFIRHSNAIVKMNAKDLNIEKFVRSSENEVLYFSFDTIYKINLETKNCTCRWYCAYAACQHKVRAFNLFDVQDHVSKFVFRAKKGRKDEKDRAAEAVANVFASTNSHLTFHCLVILPFQLIQLNTHLNAYYNSIYLTESKYLISRQPNSSLELLKDYKNRDHSWNSLMQRIESLPDSPSEPIIMDLDRQYLTSTNESQLDFKHQFDATIQVLKSPKVEKKVSKTKRVKTMDRGQVLSQLQPDNEPKRGRGRLKLIHVDSENVPIAAKGPGRGAKAKKALVHQ